MGVCNLCNEEVREGMKRGDWICRACKNHNFAKRTHCANQLCGAQRREGDGEFRSGKGAGRQQEIEQEKKRASAQVAASVNNVAALMNWSKDPKKDPDWKPPDFRKGDWMCHRCNNHNFAARMDCSRCHTQREYFDDDKLSKEWAEYKVRMGPPERFYQQGK